MCRMCLSGTTEEVALRVIVTGGSGKLGHETVRQLIAAGYEVVNLDRNAPPERLCRFMPIDFTDYGQVLESLTEIDGGWSGVDAVVHLAAIPGPSNAANAALFANNTISTFNVFWACKAAGIKNIVWASSETLTGIPFDDPPPHLPIDETSPRRPQTAYALSKLVDEVLAEEFCRWDPTLKMIGLRISYVQSQADYRDFPRRQADIEAQYWNFWSYVDVRDAASAVVLALGHKTTGLDVFLVAAADTIMTETTAALLAARFPNVPIRMPLEGHGSVLSTAKARAILGWAPRHSWRELSL